MQSGHVRVKIETAGRTFRATPHATFVIEPGRAKIRVKFGGKSYPLDLGTAASWPGGPKIAVKKTEWPDFAEFSYYVAAPSMVHFVVLQKK